MRLTPKLAAAAMLISSAVIAVGCNAKPQSVVKVDQSVLPVEAKGMLVNDAQITSVYKETYPKGTVIYRINYNSEGKAQTISYNAKMQSTPTGVFEAPMR